MSWRVRLTFNFRPVVGRESEPWWWELWFEDKRITSGWATNRLDALSAAKEAKARVIVSSEGWTGESEWVDV